MLANNQITQEEYLDMLEASTQESAKALADLENITKSNEDKIFTDLPKLKKELLVFLGFKELTPEVIDRLIERVEVKTVGTMLINYRSSSPVK